MDIKELMASVRPVRVNKVRKPAVRITGGVVTHKGYFESLTEAAIRHGLTRDEGRINIKTKMWRLAAPEEDIAGKRLNPL